MAKQILPVAIVGGGPVGLVSSILLSMLKIPNRVFEQYPGTSIHPKACGLNQRSVELFRRIGVEKEFKQARAPTNIVGKTGWFTGIGPRDRAILVRDAWGGGKYAEAYEKYSPCEYSVLPQIRLEPILQQRALSLNPKAVQYNAKVAEVVEKADHVTLVVNNADGSSEEVNAKYVLGADGGRGMAERLGIGWVGERDILDMITVHFKSDIAKIHPNKDVFISWLVNPRMKGSIGTGYLYHLGPYNTLSGTGNEYVLATPKMSEDPAQFDEETTTARVRKSLGIPDLNVDIMSISHWLVNARVTDRYRSKNGRIFLVGDACHRVPPWGALGLNSGFGDVQNLIWKPAYAIRSGRPHEYGRLLDTYDQERRPIATMVAKNSLSNMRNHANIIDKSLGITSETSTEENIEAINAYFDPSHPDHQTKRQNIEDAADILDHEFHAPGIEIGWFYPSADINEEGGSNRHGGQLKENGDFDIVNYHPSTIPGHNLPHAWLKKGDRTVSTRDLVRIDNFVLITHGGGDWNQFKSDLVDIEVIDGGRGWTDVEGTWAELSDVAKDGAILVRPDGIVAWRSRIWNEDMLEKFHTAFAQIRGGPWHEANETL